MPRLETTTRQLYQFDELTDKAKDKAREWWRESSIHDEWWDSVYEDAKQCGAILGIEIAARNQKCVLIGSKPREWIDRSPAIYFSGFSSQGDGACFEGSYAYAKGAAKAIRDHAPQDEKLHAIADELQAWQSRNFYQLTAATKQSGHYSHSGCMAVDVDGGDLGAEQGLTSLLRAFADWIYCQLEAEYTYQQSDEHVDESIQINKYEFTAAGEIA